MNKYDRHLEHSQLTENSINERMLNKELNIKDTIIKNIQNENLYNAISKLPSIQNASIHKYFLTI